jgi:hypothetical protein
VALRTKKATEASPAPAEPSYDEIAARAYEIHESGEGGDEVENWLRAETELRGAAVTPIKAPAKRRAPAAKKKAEAA